MMYITVMILMLTVLGCSLIYYNTVNHEEGGSKFVIITFENPDSLKILFCTVENRKKVLHLCEKCPPRLNIVLTLPCENEASHFILL